jgi:hypothetical protein
MASYSIPAGYKFHPSDEDVVRFYLRPKATGQPLPYPDIVFEFDLYGEKEPSEIWDMFGGPSLDETEDLFFFTKLKPLSRSRVNRSVGIGGTWSNESSKTIFARGTRIPIAMKRNFRYENPGSPQDGAWIMREYSLPMKTQPDVGSSSSSSYVVCRLSKNDRPKQKVVGEVPPKKEEMKSLINLHKRKIDQER